MGVASEQKTTMGLTIQRTQNIMWTNDGTGDNFGLARLLVVPHSVAFIIADLQDILLHRFSGPSLVVHS